MEFCLILAKIVFVIVGSFVFGWLLFVWLPGFIISRRWRPHQDGTPLKEDYFKLVEQWAREYDAEAIHYSAEELGALYDDAYFDAMEADG